MAGLLGDVLPWVYGKGNKLRGLLDDPMGGVQNALMDANTRAKGLLDMTYGAASEGAKNGPQTNALMQLLGDSYNPAGMTAWHGSPHAFDRFSAAKIGTGEGHQAYGHGLYLAESPQVAKQYAENVKDMGAVQSINSRMSELAKLMSSEEIPGAYGKYRTDAGRNAAAEYQSLMAQRSAGLNAPGNLYKVDLPDEHVAKMLDWDKPLSQQSESVRAAVMASDHPMMRYWAEKSAVNPAYDGADLYLRLGGKQEAAETLRQSGIPGVRYLDGGSRGVGKGTSNFVVFPGEENALKILERKQAR